MKVRELIEVLQKLDPERNLYTSGYEGGVNDLEPPSGALVPVTRNVNTDWYYGTHEHVLFPDENSKIDDEGYLI